MSGIVQGLGAIGENMGSDAINFKLEDGKSAVIRFVTKPENMVGVWEHVEQINGNWKTVTCLGKANCPLCKAGKKASFKTYAVIAERSDGDRLKIYKASKTVTKQLIGLVEEYADITARDFKLTRTGQKFDTTYQFFPRDPQPFNFNVDDMPNLQELVAPLPASEIQAMLDGASMADNSNDGNQNYNSGNANGGNGFPEF